VAAVEKSAILTLHVQDQRGHQSSRHTHPERQASARTGFLVREANRRGVG
jgi:hypothetical protein